MTAQQKLAAALVLLDRAHELERGARFNLRHRSFEESMRQAAALRTQCRPPGGRGPFSSARGDGMSARLLLIVSEVAATIGFVLFAATCILLATAGQS